ncbi:MAG: bleomycin resistance protein [Patescibacteria group bacterium]
MKFNRLIPELSVIDFNKSIKFYVNIIGFKTEYSRGYDGEESKFALISMQGSQFMIDEVNIFDPKEDKFVTANLEYPLGRGVNFQIEVESVEPILLRLKENKYPLQMNLTENWYRQNDKLLGNREFMVLDPDGYLLRFAEDLGDRPL